MAKWTEKQIFKRVIIVINELGLLSKFVILTVLMSTVVLFSRTLNGLFGRNKLRAYTLHTALNGDPISSIPVSVPKCLWKWAFFELVNIRINLYFTPAHLAHPVIELGRNCSLINAKQQLQKICKTVFLLSRRAKVFLVQTRQKWPEEILPVGKPLKL